MPAIRSERAAPASTIRPFCRLALQDSQPGDTLPLREGVRWSAHSRQSTAARRSAMNQGIFRRIVTALLLLDAALCTPLCLMACGDCADCCHLEQRTLLQQSMPAVACARCTKSEPVGESNSEPPTQDCDRSCFCKGAIIPDPVKPVARVSIAELAGIPPQASIDESRSMLRTRGCPIWRLPICDGRAVRVWICSWLC